jgi:hypothetical protein
MAILAPKLAPLPSHDTPIGAAQLIAHTGIEADARGLGTRGLPAAGETELARSEAAVKEINRGRIDKRHEDLDRAENRMRAELAELPDTRTDAGGDRLDEDVAQAIDGLFRTFDGTIREVVGAKRKAQAQFNAYIEKHGHLERSASYKLSKVNHFTWVGLGFGGEVVFNGVMLIPASDNGLMGGIATSVMVAVASIGTALFAFGVPARYLSYHNLPPEQPNRRLWTRLWAVPALILSVLVIFGVNLYVAHWRDVATASEGAFDERLVLDHLLTKPFELSLSSFGLLVAGLLFAAFAAHKAYTASDKYPGYEQETRKVKEPEADANDLKVSVIGHIDAIKQTTVDGLFNQATARQAALENLRGQRRRWQDAKAKAERLDTSDIEAGHEALRHFRRLNLRVRTDDVVPNYFTDFTLGELVPEASGTDPAAEIEAATEAHIKHTEALLKLIERQIQRIGKAKEIVDQVMPADNAKGVEVDLPTPEEIRRMIDEQVKAATPTRKAA